jgi:hypothetical protein
VRRVIARYDEASMESTACLNCGNELAGRWCSQCGQRAVEPRPTVHELLHEAFHELSHLDGKMLRTVKLLLFRPGVLTREFFHGKRVRYVSPIRLYLICSLLFFGIMSLTPTRKLHVSVTGGGFHIGRNDAAPPPADPQLVRAAERVNKDPDLLVHAFETAFPKAMFILMPLFALIVFGFYWRAERMYVPHFYFAVHYHAFAFVVLALFTLAGLLHGVIAIILKFLLLFALFHYLGVALRRVYGGSRWMTAAKVAAIMPLYGMAVVTAMGLIALVTLRRLG